MKQQYDLIHEKSVLLICFGYYFKRFIFGIDFVVFNEVDVYGLTSIYCTGKMNHSDWSLVKKLDSSK